MSRLNITLLLGIQYPTDIWRWCETNPQLLGRQSQPLSLYISRFCILQTRGQTRSTFFHWWNLPSSSPATSPKVLDADAPPRQRARHVCWTKGHPWYLMVSLVLNNAWGVYRIYMTTSIHIIYCMNICTYAYTYKYTYTFIYIYIYVYICVYVM